MTKQHQPRPFIDLIIGIIIPSVILMKMSGDDALGPTMALIVALSFPLSWGLFELIKYKKYNFIALLGLISVLLTGGIGLLALDTKWLAIKEAAIPGIIGLAVLASAFTRYPLIRVLIFNPQVMNIQRIEQVLSENGQRALFEQRLLLMTFLLAGTFVFSSVMNFILTKWIVVSPAGTEAFNEELGKLALYSYPVIAIPSMIMTLAIFYYLWRTLNKMTGLPLEELLSEKLVNK